MPKKGVSAIIATILLLMITIAMAGLAYVYISGMLTGKTEKTISIINADCTGNLITLVISNDGTKTVTKSDVKIFVGNVENTTFVLDEIKPHETGITNILGGNGANNVLVITPSNAARQVTYC